MHTLNRQLHQLEQTFADRRIPPRWQRQPTLGRYRTIGELLDTMRTFNHPDSNGIITELVEQPTDAYGVDPRTIVVMGLGRRLRMNYRRLNSADFDDAMTAEELSALTPLQGIPENLLHYAIVLPSLAEIEQVLAAIRNQGGTVIQGTQPGAPQQPPAQPGQPTPVPPAPGGPPPAGQIILEPGEYTSDGGGCGLPGRTTVSGIASDGSGWTWGRVRFNRSSPNTYYAGGILAIVLSPTSFRIGGTGPGACISIWSRTG